MSEIYFLKEANQSAEFWKAPVSKSQSGIIQSPRSQRKKSDHGEEKNIVEKILLSKKSYFSGQGFCDSTRHFDVIIRWNFYVKTTQSKWRKTRHHLCQKMSKKLWKSKLSKYHGNKNDRENQSVLVLTSYLKVRIHCEIIDSN